MHDFSVLWGFDAAHVGGSSSVPPSAGRLGTLSSADEHCYLLLLWLALQPGRAEGGGELPAIYSFIERCRQID